MNGKRLILFFLVNVFLSLYKSILIAVIVTAIQLLFSVVEKVKK